MVVTDRTWHHDALDHLANAAHSEMSIRRRELRRITLRYSDRAGVSFGEGRRVVDVRAIRAVREVAFDPTEATHTASRGGASTHIVARSTISIERVGSATSPATDSTGDEGSESLRGNDAARAMSTVLCGSTHAADGSVPTGVALLEVRQAEQRARHAVHRHHRLDKSGRSNLSGERRAPDPKSSSESSIESDSTSSSIATTTAKPKRFRATRGVRDDDLELQLAFVSFTSDANEKLKDAMDAMTAIDKAQSVLVAGKAEFESRLKDAVTSAPTHDAATSGGEAMNATKKSKADAQKDKVIKEQIWTDSLTDVKNSVDAFYNK